MRLVVIESPYSAETLEGIEANLSYARACLRDCLRREESPIASHLLLTQGGVLDDSDPVERAWGMHAGWAWMRVADAVVVYVDRGISAGMREGISEAGNLGVAVEFRSLEGGGAGFLS